MTAIWQNNGGAWQLLSPSGFPKEAMLHDLVESAPHTLPLAGDPNLVMLGREVFLGGNRPDLIAMEQNGRLVVIEIKLAYDPGSRSGVIAQILTYAAYLKGMSIATLEREVLGSHLRKRGYQSLAHAAEVNDQEGGYDAESFTVELAASLAEGRFRLVIVLDEAPRELVRLAGFLEAVADRLTIDLVTVSAYTIGDAQIIVPQRVEPERHDHPAQPPTTPPSVNFFEGAGEFAASISQAKQDRQPLLRRLLDWALNLENENLARLGTYRGKKGIVTLLPRLPADGVGMVTIYNAPGGAYLQFWRGVIERRAPRTLTTIEAAAAPAVIRQGSTSHQIDGELLEALTAAYREAASGRVEMPSPTALTDEEPE